MDKTEYIAQGTRDGLFKNNAKLRRYYNYNWCVTHSFRWIRYRFGNKLLTSQLLKDSIWMYECMKNLVLYNLFCFLKNISHLKCIVHTLYVMPASLFSVHRRYTCSNTRIFFYKNIKIWARLLVLIFGVIQASKCS